MNPTNGRKSNVYDNAKRTNNEFDHRHQQQQIHDNDTQSQNNNCHESRSTVFSIPSSPSINYSVTAVHPNFKVKNDPNR